MVKCTRITLSVIAIALVSAVVSAGPGALRNKRDGVVRKGAVLGTVLRDGEKHFVLETEDGETVLLPVREWEALDRAQRGEGTDSPAPASSKQVREQQPPPGGSKEPTKHTGKSPGVQPGVASKLKLGAAYLIRLDDGGKIVGEVLGASGGKITVQVAGSMRVTINEDRVTSAHETTRKLESGRYDATVMFIQIFGSLQDRLVADRVCADIATAARRGATVVVVEIDTPGGRIDLAERICASLTALSTAKTIALVGCGKSKGAFSAGAFLAMACDEIYMAPTAAIGAALPYFAKTGAPQVDEKLTSAFCATMRAVAARRGHPTEIAAAMVDPDIELREVKLGGRRYFVSPERAARLVQQGGTLASWITFAGKVLTLTSDEAVDVGLASGKATGRKDILKVLGFKRPAVIDRRTGVAVARGLAIKQQALLRVQALYGLLVREWERGQRLAAGGDPDGAMRAYRLTALACIELKGLAQRYSDSNVNMTELRVFVAQLRTAFDSAHAASLQLQLARWREQQAVDELRRQREELERIRRELEWQNSGW